MSLFSSVIHATESRAVIARDLAKYARIANDAKIVKN
jgi:hypothetical protein